MGQETENPIEFLNAAEEAVSAYSELKKSLEEERDRKRTPDRRWKKRRSAFRRRSKRPSKRGRMR